MVEDLDSAIFGLTGDLRGKLSGSDSIEIAEREIQKSLDLKKEFERLILVEMAQRPQYMKFRKTDDEKVPKEEDTQRTTNTTIGKSKTVLTLYGGERQAKQLFSSLAKPDFLDREINEQALPNGISATTIIPTRSLSDETKPTAPILGTVFASNARSLDPPKQSSKHTATRSSSVNWYNPADAASAPKEPSLRPTYSKQPLSSGQWLTYNAVPSSAQLATPETKRKQRDRALSFGEPQASLSEETMAAHNQAKEDALFRSVYSSFAPDRDDTGSIVSEQQRNRLWWAKIGEAEYQKLLDMKYGPDQGSEALEKDAVADEDEIDEEMIKEAIESWEPEDSAEVMKDKEADPAAKDTDSILQEISDLLETLNSYQRIRNLSQITSTRTMPGQNAQLASMSGGPSSPSPAEFDTYDVLKDQLALIVANLPPYMVAKLDGDKLGALTISTRIPILAKDQKGTLTEDELSTRAKVPARNGGTGTTPQTVPYTVPPGRTNSYPQAATTPAQQYAQRHTYGQQAVPRPPSVASAYPSSQYLGGRPGGTPQYTHGTARPSYSSQGSYPPQRTPSSSYTERFANGVAQVAQAYGQPPPQSYSQYPNTYRPPAAQHAGSYSQQYSTPQARAASSSMAASQAYRGSQWESQQRAPAPPAYNYGSIPTGGSASPQNHHRSSMSAQGQGQGQGPGTAPQRPQLWNQHSSHYGSRTSAEPQVNGAGGTASGRMSPDEQAALMNRQKVQLAEQQSSVVRQGSHTPQLTPGQTPQQNGSPAPVPNGVTV